MIERVCGRLEAKLQAIIERLSKPCGIRTSARFHPRIGRLREACPSVAPHYRIEIASNDHVVSAMTFSWLPSETSKASLPDHITCCAATI